MKKFLPNLIYLLLSLPIGILYFVILIIRSKSKKMNEPDREESEENVKTGSKT